MLRRKAKVLNSPAGWAQHADLQLSNPHPSPHSLGYALPFPLCTHPQMGAPWQCQLSSAVEHPSSWHWQRGDA